MAEQMGKAKPVFRQRFFQKTEKIYLICDNPGCKKARLITKEGDNLGIEAIRERIEADKEVMKTLLKLEGVPKIYLRNAIPIYHSHQ